MDGWGGWAAGRGASGREALREGKRVELCWPRPIISCRHGAVDADVYRRTSRTAQLHQSAVARGHHVQVLTTGGSGRYNPSAWAKQGFNPTATPHWQYVAATLRAAGVPDAALLKPGLPALTTVHEAVMTHALLERAATSTAAAPQSNATWPALEGLPDLVTVVVSEWHAARVELLFGLALRSCRHATCARETMACAVCQVQAYFLRRVFMHLPSCSSRRRTLSSKPRRVCDSAAARRSACDS